MRETRRNAERLPIHGGLTAHITVLQPAAVVEIGTGGALIETAAPLHLDAIHDLRLLLDDRTVVVQARVVHSQISDVDQDLVCYRAGIEFIEPTAEASTTIADYVDRLKATRRGL